MSGTATIIKMRVLKRGASGVEGVIDEIPDPSELNYSTDMRQFSGIFDFQIHFGEGESFGAKSHDFVEFYFDTPAGEHQIGVGFVEDFVRQTDSSGASFAGNGRDLLGQLINIDFKSPIYWEDGSLTRLVPMAVKNAYLEQYLTYRGNAEVLEKLNAFEGSMLIKATAEKRGAVLQEYADIGLNLVYQNRLGQVALYGRNQPDGTPLTVGKPLGKLVKARGRSNIESLNVKQNFSKVFSEASVFWASGEAAVDKRQRVSPILTNTDPRVAHIYQPHRQVYAMGELAQLAGKAGPEARMRQIGSSTIRRSNQFLNEVIVVVPRPYFEDGSQIIPYDKGQIWHIESPEDELDLPMKLAGIHYSQGDARLEVQLAFVEPDTLV
jgi:hypothetical protein